MAATARWKKLFSSPASRAASTLSTVAMSFEHRAFTIETREEPSFAELIRDVRKLLREGGGFEAHEAEGEEEELIAAEEKL